MYLLGKCGSHRYYGDGDINSYISSHINTLEKAELTRCAILRDFQNQEYRFTNGSPGQSWQKNEKKKDKKKNTSNGKSVMHLTQTQKHKI